MPENANRSIVVSYSESDKVAALARAKAEGSCELGPFSQVNLSRLDPIGQYKPRLLASFAVHPKLLLAPVSLLLCFAIQISPF